MKFREFFPSFEKALDIKKAKVIPSPQESKTAQEIKDIVKDVQLRLAETMDFSDHNKIVDFAEKLKKYPNCDRVYMYHILAGSSGKNAQIYDSFDFPEPNSVVSFVRKELEQPEQKTASAAA